MSLKKWFVYSWAKVVVTISAKKAYMTYMANEAFWYYIVGTSERHRTEDRIDTIDTGSVHIKTSDCVKSLGVVIDSKLTFNQHVSNICKSAHLNIKALRHIRKLLPDDAAKSVACAMVAGRLDYCNAVLYGTSSANIDKLQRLQNMLARVVTNTRRRDHITPVLADLHWLPVRYRIEYKVALITFKALTTQQPQYLSELIRYYEAPRKLRSRGVNILQTNATALDFSKRAFCHASPTVWNSLPQSVISDLTVTTGTFKHRLKSAMYTRAFLQWHVTPTLAILHNLIVNDLTCV